MDQVWPQKDLDAALNLYCYTLETCWWENQGGKFVRHSLPTQVQVSAVQGILADDFNGERDAMQDGTLRCPECSGTIDADTFLECGRQYAGRYSADGYMDCTDWHYDTNKRRLERDLREMYGNG